MSKAVYPRMGRTISLIVLTAVLPGALSYAVVRSLVVPPVKYVVMPPEKRRVADEERVVHRRAIAGDETAMPQRALPDEPARDATTSRQPLSGERIPGRGRRQEGDGDARNRPQIPAPARRNSGTPDRSTAPPPVSRPGGTSSMPNRQPRGSMTADERMATFMLIRLFRGIGQLEEDGRHTLSPAQARAILALMKPLRAQPSLTGAQASRIVKDIRVQLTAAQREVLEHNAGSGSRGSGRSSFGRPDERRPGGEGRPGGDPGMRGGGVMNANPFNPTSGHPMAERMTERWDAIFAALEAKARQ